MINQHFMNQKHKYTYATIQAIQAMPLRGMNSLKD